MTFTCRILKNDLPAIAAHLMPKAREVRLLTAHAIQADWAGDVRVDTGAYRASIKVEEDGPDTTVVYSGIAYAIYNELGTRKMPARPSATSAAERHRAAYDRAMAQIASL